MEFVFGQIWSRDALDAKQRSLVTIGILIALRQTEELKSHIRIGLTHGLTVRQIEEATIQAAAYAGFPAAHTASKTILEVLQDPSFAAPPRRGDRRVQLRGADAVRFHQDFGNSAARVSKTLCDYGLIAPLCRSG